MNDDERIAGFLEKSLLAGGVLPADLHTVGLCQANGEQQGHPEDSTLGLNLLEVANCWACNMQGRILAYMLTLSV